MKHMKIVIAQAVFLIAIFSVVYLIYPRTDIKLQEDNVNFKSINANAIVISENPDFSNSRYIKVGRDENISINLKPGTYYWKPTNDYIEGFQKSFTIESEVGLKIDMKENDSTLVNIGNVKVNVTRTKEGILVGHIILEPNESQKIEEGKYEGRQDD